MSSSVTVNVYGPNLDDQSLGDIHIHKAGCNHPAPLEGDLPAEVLSISADSKREILDTVYPPDEFEDTSIDWLHWSACTRSIQREPSAPDTPTDVDHGWVGLQNGGVLKLVQTAAQFAIEYHPPHKGYPPYMVMIGKRDAVLASLSGIIYTYGQEK